MVQTVCEHCEWIEVNYSDSGGNKSTTRQCRFCGKLFKPTPTAHTEELSREEVSKEEAIEIIGSNLYNIRNEKGHPLMDTGKCDEIAEFIYNDLKSWLSPAPLPNGFTREDIGKELVYWRQRCLAAEFFIKESPCDPDITLNQIEAYNKWQDLNKSYPTKPNS